MKAFCIAVCALVAAATAACAASPEPTAVHAPEGLTPRSIALIVSDLDGWTPSLDQTARTLSRLHTLAVGVDLRALRAASNGCVDAAGLAMRLAEEAWRAQGLPGRIAPTLVGIGAGAGVVYAALAQGVAAKGAVTVGFDGVARLNLCGVARAGERFTLPPKSPTLWNEAPLRPGAGDAAPAAESLRRIEGVRIEPLAADDASARMAAFEQAYLRIAGVDAFDRGAPEAPPAGLDDLPLTIHADPAAPPSGLMAVFISGDGGWAKLDHEVADRLAAAGVPVVGVSALRYFWTEKRPDRIAADVARIAAAYGPSFDATGLLLIGFSLGANVTPFYAPLIDGAMPVIGAALIAPEARTGFEFHVGGWLGYAADDHDVGAAIDAAGMPLICLHGTEEADSPCRGRPGSLAFEGGHHLGGDHDGIAAAILRAFQTRRQAAASISATARQSSEASGPGKAVANTSASAR